MDNLTIKTLKGPDRVRKRPAVAFGSEKLDGAVNAVKKLTDIFVAEAFLGFSKRIDLSVHNDNSISIRSFDRGFLLDETNVDGKPAWYYDFCELYADPREIDEDYYFSLEKNHNNLYGNGETSPLKYKVESDHSIDLCCVQYASEYMHVEATRDGLKKSLDFKKGYSICDVIKENSSEATNTFIHFKLDTQVFEDVAVQNSDICKFLQTAAITIPNLECNFKDERLKTSVTYKYPNGAKDYILQKASVPIPLYAKELEARGKDENNAKEYDAKAKIFFVFTEMQAEITCFHNYKTLKFGGDHLSAVKSKIIKELNLEFNEGEKSELSFEDIADNIILILETNCTNSATRYSNATKTAITNKMIADMSRDLIDEDFKCFLKQNHDSISKILKKLS